MKGYVPLHVRYGTRRVKARWWFRRRFREGLALRLAPWFGWCLADNAQMRDQLVFVDEAARKYSDRLDALDLETAEWVRSKAEQEYAIGMSNYLALAEITPRAIAAMQRAGGGDDA